MRKAQKALEVTSRSLLGARVAMLWISRPTLAGDLRVSLWGLQCCLLLKFSQALLQVREGEVACVQRESEARSSWGPSIKEGGRKEARAGSPGWATNSEDKSPSILCPWGARALWGRLWQGSVCGDSSKDPQSSLCIRIPCKTFSRWHVLGSTLGRLIN